MIYLILVGFIAGIISGMGIGGGTILIPSLIFLTHLEQHTVQGINLLYFIPTAIIALTHHVKDNKVKKDLLKGLIVGGILGAFIGALIANNIDSMYLKKIFGIFLLVMGLHEVFIKAKKPE